jgi:formamidopyrimidine-DNA glycosylase
MSVEAPEAYLLATQMRRELVGKQVSAVNLQNCTKLQQIGCVTKDSAAFQLLVGCRVEQVASRGLVLLLGFERGLSLVLAPEYGGHLCYYPTPVPAQKNFHLNLSFMDQTALTVTLTGIGIIQVFPTAKLQESYVYRRDFSTVPSPLTSTEFPYLPFAQALAARNANIKSALVGKDALVVGLSNSSFQDLLFRAKIHPKRKANSLNETEKHALYEAILQLMAERLAASGKTQFTDLYGTSGKYEIKMGPNWKHRQCSRCGTPIESTSLGGGQVFFCPTCQK